ncbi:hypothetical protein H6775_01460 [Candidatus Nomurabacteria bacterium]|nr:hypothetical protein [Candidatus Nomurabacteria bacterium]
MKKTLLVILWFVAILLLLIDVVLLFGGQYSESKTQKKNRVALEECDYLFSSADFTNGYIGGDYGKCLHDKGYICDYGYSVKYGGCCDEDNYDCENCSSNRYDCSDFSDQEQAQYIFDTCNKFYDNIYDIH